MIMSVYLWTCVPPHLKVERAMGKRQLNTKKWYTPAQAGRFLRIQPDTIKKHCRGGTLKGKQVGPKKQWMIPGTEIARKRKEWRLDGIDS
jgi:hypothetical protein